MSEQPPKKAHTEKQKAPTEKEMQDAVDDLPLYKRRGENCGMGFYRLDGCMYFNVAENLQARGIPLTPENEREALKHFQNIAREAGKPIIAANAKTNTPLSSEFPMPAGDHCPHCGLSVSRATSVDGKVHTPDPGSVLICIGCMGLSIVGDDGRGRLPNADEERELRAHKQVAAALATLKKAKERTA